MGTVCNVNADDAAAGLARGLAAEVLVLLTDTDGVQGDDGARISWLAAGQVETLIEAGTIDGGMAPKVRAALAAVSDGDATSVVIADGGMPRVLERAMAGDDIGTRIVADAAAQPAAATAREHVS
jgi:acetylglutamate kinase